MWTKFIVATTLGNIGETSTKCKMQSLKAYYTKKIECPSGSKIREVSKIGYFSKDQKFSKRKF